MLVVYIMWNKKLFLSVDSRVMCIEVHYMGIDSKVVYNKWLGDRLAFPTSE